MKEINGMNEELECWAVCHGKALELGDRVRTSEHCEEHDLIGGEFMVKALLLIVMAGLLSALTMMANLTILKQLMIGLGYTNCH